MTQLSLITAIVLACIGCSSSAPPAGAPIDNPPAAAATKGTIPPERPAAKISGMPIYITPYFNSEGPQINVGPYSKELTSVTADSISPLAEKMKTEWATLPIETMYVMSIRLYDFGHKNDAVYWFYSAQFRSRLLRSLLPTDSLGGIGSEGFERIQAHNAFQKLAGEYINGYAFGELDNLQKTVRLVRTENQTIPQLKAIYPNLVFVDNESWPPKNEEVAAGLDKLLDYIANNAEEIEATRKKNGIEGKY